MTSLASLFLTIGLVGLLGATFLPGLLAILITRTPSSSRPTASRETAVPPTLQILVTAHNEESTIVETLHSLVQAVHGSAITQPTIVVGLDHCTDRTETVVHDFAKSSAVPITCQRKQGSVGKWRMVVELVRSARAEWVALVDCGSSWDVLLLPHVLPYLQTDGVQAVAPSYMPRHAGFLERLHWRLEQSLKALETHSGGPISVHGATVFYRRETLLAALDRLARRDWLNDDLVVPSMIRLMNASNRVAYLRFKNSALAYVVDQGLKPAASVEYRRRQRIMHGSTQWLQLMVEQRSYWQPGIALLASRRVCRMLWAYWVTFLAVAAILTSLALPEVGGWVAGAFVLAAGLVAIGSNFIRRMGMAYVSAMIAPVYLVRQLAAGLDSEAVPWQ